MLVNCFPLTFNPNPSLDIDPEPKPATRGQPKTHFHAPKLRFWLPQALFKVSAPLEGRKQPKTQFQAPKLRFWPPQALEPLTLIPNPKTLTLSLKPKTEPLTQPKQAFPGRKQSKTQFRARKLRFWPPQALEPFNPLPLTLTPTRNPEALTLIPNPIQTAKNAISVPRNCVFGFHKPCSKLSAPFKGRRQAKTQFRAPNLRFWPPQALLPLT